MKYRSTNELRKLFLDFFKEKDHMVEPGASLVPKNDKTLLWINSGVAALKKYFDGSVVPKNKKIVNAQKAIRTNDIENVGLTARHHTFFEMLGNFSIGGYFKKEAIEYAWEFLTSKDYVGMDKDKIYVSVHSHDQRAYDVWVNDVGIDPSKVLKTEGNFWEIGEGPSGPNSEIFFDRGKTYDPQDLGEKLFFEEIDNDRYLEVWNIVFSQYDAKANVQREDYKELPQKNIDTGMGLERLACIVQEKETNFETDIFQKIISEIETYAKCKYESNYKISYKIISDHIRTLVFALSDGAMFSNEGRGYVLRRLLRRAVRHSKVIGVEDNYLYKLVPTVVDAMKEFYPYLEEKTAFNQKMILNEEERFMLTLALGEQHLADELKKAKNKKLTGKTAFKLYDTYGFPVELTEEIAKESGYLVDLEGFKKEMQAQKDRARLARSEKESMTSQSKDLLEYKEESEFLGYNKLSSTATIKALFHDGQRKEEVSDDFSMICDQTPFYAESGGQVGDIGYIELENKKRLEIVDTVLAPNGQHLHIVKSNEKVKENEKVKLVVDNLRRQQIKRNHSSVHLLHAALIDALGDHVGQAGSFVNEKYARLDFNHFEKIKTKDLKEIEETVNNMINSAKEVNTELMTISEAKQSGALALFDEKYGDLVRVVSMGKYSKELCGGTHVSNTAEIGAFKILSEESVGSGIRRLNFTTGQNVYKRLVQVENRVENIQNILGVKQKDQIEEKLNDILNKKESLEKEIASFSQMKLDAEIEKLKNDAINKKDFKVISKIYESYNAKDLKYIADAIRNEVKDILIILATKKNNKLVFVVACDKTVNEAGLNAGNIAKELAVYTGGNGGGRKDFAQSGGKEVNKAKEAIDNLLEKIQ